GEGSLRAMGGGDLGLASLVGSDAAGLVALVAFTAFTVLAGLAGLAAAAFLATGLAVFPALAAGEGFLAGLAAFFTGFLAATYEGSSDFSPTKRESAPL